MEQDYGILSFDNYIFFDADNVVAPSFVEEFNKPSSPAPRSRRHIHCPVGKQILYLLCFPWVDAITLPMMIITLFTDAKWTPIVHKNTTKIVKFTGETQTAASNSEAERKE